MWETELGSIGGHEEGRGIGRESRGGLVQDKD